MLVDDGLYLTCACGHVLQAKARQTKWVADLVYAVVRDYTAEQEALAFKLVSNVERKRSNVLSPARSPNALPPALFRTLFLPPT